jgi:hypothetical protein
MATVIHNSNRDWPAVVDSLIFGGTGDGFDIG